MEALAAIGILCNVMQIVTFGKDALHVYRYVRENGTPDAKLEAYLAGASTSYQEMNNQLSRNVSPTNDQKEIIKLGQEAYQSLQRFQIYFEELMVDETSRKGFRGKLRIVKSSIKTLFRNEHLEDLEKNFQRYEQQLQTRLIRRICDQTDAMTLLAQDSFKKLNDAQQCVVQKIAQGHTDISLLLSQSTAETKRHINDQHKETQDTLKKHLAVTEHNLESKVSRSTSVIQEDLACQSKAKDTQMRHDQLLASLRYPEMNGRKNQVVTSFPKTFQWIFSREGPWEDKWSSDYSSLTSDGDAASDEESELSDGKNSYEEQGDYKTTTQDSDASTVEGDPAVEDVSDEYDTASTASYVSVPTAFVRWLSSESQMFWISGKPASGKSTLMKFIATNTATKENLADWRPNAKILCHYFWKAGSVRERSLEGFLLSLTHQVLLDKIDLSQQMWEDIPEVRHKWSHADWDLQQLETALLWALNAAAESFLLIIDGLDESEDFERQLLTLPRRPNILDHLSKLKDIKVCVSSREEYTFTTYFNGVERLQLHELTEYDIRQFANARLVELSFAKHEDRKWLLDRIVSRASGVFLWVTLVLDSITRAIRIDNSIENLIERVDHMPRDLIDLVREMWGRSGEDGEITSYRASASHYFNLALESSYSDWHYREHSMLLVAIASDKRDLGSILDIDCSRDIDELEKLCLKAEHELRIVCHGLLEVQNPLPTPDIPLRGIMYYKLSTVRFAHRCVIDFLRDTESGAALLGACGRKKEEVRARRVATSIVEGLLPLKNPTRDPNILIDEIYKGKRYVLHSRLGYVDWVISHLADFDLERPYGNLLFHKFIQRYFDGLASDCVMWPCSGRSVFTQDPLRNEFLASVAKTASTSFLETLISMVSIEDFLSAIPAIFRGLSTGFLQPDSEIESHLLKAIALTEQILARLIGLKDEDEETSSLKAVTGETREDLQRLVCSWILGTLVGFDNERLGKTLKTSRREILHLITLSLPAIEDWNESLLVSLTKENAPPCSFNGFLTIPPEECYCSFVVMNLATAFQLVLQSRQYCATQSHPNDDTQIPHLPDGVEPSLRLVSHQHKEPNASDAWSTHRRNLVADVKSGALLRSLLAESPTMNNMTTIEGTERPRIASHWVVIAHYLVEEFDDPQGLPIHPWSAWHIEDASEQEETGSLDEVEERSPEPFIQLLHEIRDS